MFKASSAALLFSLSHSTLMELPLSIRQFAPTSLLSQHDRYHKETVPSIKHDTNQSGQVTKHLKDFFDT